MYHELDAFVKIRQQNLTSDEHRHTVRATTILVTSIPKNFLNVNTLKQVFSVFPGGVKNVFLNRDCSDLLDDVQRRDQIAKLLESAETELIVKANKAHRKKNKKLEEKSKEKDSGKIMETASAANDVDGARQEVEVEYLAEKYLPKKKRPTYRIPLASWMPSLPLIGKKVWFFLFHTDIGRFYQLGSTGIGPNESFHRTPTSPSGAVRSHEFGIYTVQHPTCSSHGLSERRLPQDYVYDTPIY
jgi:Cytosolic domain of 10TM putative phosphate transporter